MTTPHPPLTEREAALWLGISPQTLKRWREAKRGPRYTRMGRELQYDLDDLKAYKAAHTHEPQTAGDDEPQGAA